MYYSEYTKKAILEGDAPFIKKGKIRYDRMTLRQDGVIMVVELWYENKKLVEYDIAMPNFAAGETLNLMGFGGKVKMDVVS
jgi:hypothetical protein